MTIPTAPPSGFRDFLPEQVAARHKAAETIARVYRSFGFQPVATSAVEDLQVLLGKGGGENEKLIFKLMKRGEALERAKADGSDLADLGLRFDLTLPLARYYSKHGSQLPHPFKAFAMGPVWRAERAQKGRYREFTQCDADVVGSDSWGAEMTSTSAILAAFEAAGLPGVEVVINDRTALLGTLRSAGVSEDRLTAACITIDKLDKSSEQDVMAELGPDGEKIWAALKAAKPTDNVLKIRDAVNRLVGRGAVSDTPFLVRGFDYYTTTVFEFRHPSFKGSIGGGGRYDRLTEKFGGQPVPAVGGSIGFERLLLVLEEKGLASDPGAPDAVVTVFSDDLRGRSLEVAAALRAKGLRADLYPGGGKLKAQFKYADQKKAAFALVIGPDEAARGVVQVKDLRTGEELPLSLEEAAAKVLSSRK